MVHILIKNFILLIYIEIKKKKKILIVGVIKILTNVSVVSIFIIFSRLITQVHSAKHLLCYIFKSIKLAILLVL